jgi:hypothetical protein
MDDGRGRGTDAKWRHRGEAALDVTPGLCRWNRVAFLRGFAVRDFHRNPRGEMSQGEALSPSALSAPGRLEPGPGSLYLTRRNTSVAP